MKRLVVAALLIIIGITGIVLAPVVSAGKPVPPPPSTSVLWAVVNVDGSLARGSGVVSTTFGDVDGVYWVEFNRDVSQCAYVAVGGEATNFPADDAITIGVSPSDRSPNEVYLIEFDTILNQDAYSSGFHLIVSC
jgi:hypothetical protein